MSGLSSEPSYPVLRMVDAGTYSFFHVVTNACDLCTVRKIELEFFERMKIVDSCGTVWQPTVKSRQVVSRTWWNLFDWFDPVIEVSLELKAIGKIRPDELTAVIVKSVEAAPDVYKASLEWYDVVEAIKRSKTIENIITAIRAWRPRHLLRNFHGDS